MHARPQPQGDQLAVNRLRLVLNVRNQHRRFGLNAIERLAIFAFESAVRTGDHVPVRVTCGVPQAGGQGARLRRRQQVLLLLRAVPFVLAIPCFFREIAFPQPVRAENVQAHLASRRPQPQLAAFEGQQVVLASSSSRRAALPVVMCSSSGDALQRGTRPVGLTLENVLEVSSRRMRRARS